MFKVKICGVRLKSDIENVESAGGDAIGLNFFPKSVRYVDPESAATLALSLHAKKLALKRVGVFVNASVDLIRQVVRPTAATEDLIDVIQLHGDETVEDAMRIEVIGLPILRAVKLPVCPLTVIQIEERLRPWADAFGAVLLDADGGAMHGGSGKTLHWESIRAWADSDRGATVWTLAGGLNPDNVASAIDATGATSVDVASGVEASRGQKSAEKIERFCQSALCRI